MLDNILKILNNYILWAALISWLAAQVLKELFFIIRHRRFSFERMVGAGGMPSSHTSTVCGLTTAVGRFCGLDSPIFAISFVLACVVMYDATGVRRAAGEQAKILNRLILDSSIGQRIDAQKTLKEFLGHTPLEVFGGAILGIVIAMLIPMG